MHLRTIVLPFLLAALSGASTAAEFKAVEGASDLQIEVLDLQPPRGSVLKATEPAVVTFRYRYSRPREPLRVWARPPAEGLLHSYQGSVDNLEPGEGVRRRFFHLNEPGVLRKVTILARDESMRYVYAREIDVDYTFVANPQADRRRDDGKGSTMTSLRFKPASPTRLAVGTYVDVDVSFDIQSTEGLGVWVEPVTPCRKSFTGPTSQSNGRGTVTKGFSIGEPCKLEQVKVMMSNAVGRTVFERIVDVDFRFQ